MRSVFGRNSDVEHLQKVRSLIESSFLILWVVVHSRFPMFPDCEVPSSNEDG